MSDPSSAESSEFEAGATAAAADASEELVAHTALGPALEALHLQKTIHQANWDSKDNPDFCDKLAGRCRLQGAANLHRDRSESSRSTSSSMAVSVSRSAPLSSISVSSSRPPSLTYSSARSTSSVKTSSVVHQFVLEEDEDGIPSVPSPLSSQGRLPCCFSFLGCDNRFDSPREWDTHCKSHLRGKLPKQAYCPFECQWTTRSETGEEAWRLRAMHIIAEHFDGGEDDDDEEEESDDVDTEKKPPAWLIEHLWRHRIIDDVGKKELQRDGRLTHRDYTMTAGSTRDHRRTRLRAN